MRALQIKKRRKSMLCDHVFWLWLGLAAGALFVFLGSGKRLWICVLSGAAGCALLALTGLAASKLLVLFAVYCLSGVPICLAVSGLAKKEKK